MDKRINFVQGMYPEDIHFNQMQDAIESADKRLTKAVAGKGIVSGFEFSIVDNTAFITAGTGFDGLGRQVHCTGAALEIDLSGITRPEPGSYKWVSFYVAFSQYSHDDVYDDNNVRHDLYTDETVTAGFIEGEEGTEEGAGQSDVGDNILVADLLIDNSSAFDSFIPSYSRRENIPTVIDLKNRLLIVNTSVDTASAKTITFASLGIADGPYSIWGQINGSNTQFIRHLALEKSETAVILYLWHDTFPFSVPVLGAPGLKIGTVKIGNFKIGDRDQIAVDLFIRKDVL